MHISLYSLLFVVTYIYTISSTSVETKWPQYIFQPRFQTALDDLKKRVQGEKDELWKVLNKIQKIEFLKNLFRFKIEALVEHLSKFETDPYECSNKEATLFENSCYLLIKEKKTWKNARKDCQSQGGDLTQISFNNFELADFVAVYLKDYKKPVYSGIISFKEGDAIHYKFLNGLKIDTGLYNPAETIGEDEKRTLVFTVDVAGGLPYIILTESPVDNLNAYLCEFKAELKTTKVDLKYIWQKEYFMDYLPNINDVEKDMPLVECKSGSQFAIGTKCYRYFKNCDSCDYAQYQCEESGGVLAKIDLSPRSRFGGVLADILRSTEIDIETGTLFPIWIESKNDGGERFLPEPLKTSGPQCSTETKEIDKKTYPPPTHEPQCLTLILPESTPKNLTDNNIWNVANAEETLEFSFLCEYPTKHW